MYEATAKPLYLASTSPRRAKLLREAGFAFEPIAPPFDDSAVDMGDTPAHLAVEALAYLKAASAAEGVRAGVVIGCDTMLAVGDRAVGKPNDRDDATRILQSLIGQPHDVVTGVALIDAATRRCEVFADRTRVTIENFGDETLERYLDSGEWRGKAGGYNLAELADRWCFKVEGDPTTVVGLPMERLTERLPRFTDPDTTAP